MLSEILHPELVAAQHPKSEIDSKDFNQLINCFVEEARNDAKPPVV